MFLHFFFFFLLKRKSEQALFSIAWEDEGEGKKAAGSIQSSGPLVDVSTRGFLQGDLKVLRGTQMYLLLWPAFTYKTLFLTNTHTPGPRGRFYK